MNPTPPTNIDSDAEEPRQPTPTAPVARRTFREALRDRRFWLIVPALLVALGLTGYFLLAGTQANQPPLISQLNTSIPNALTDSVPKSKLELQAAGQRAAGARQDAVNGLQTGLPADAGTGRIGADMPTRLDPYLYRQRPLNEPVDPSFMEPDYPAAVGRQQPPAPPAPERSYPPASSVMPTELNEQPRRQQQADERQRLLALLTEYKRDKEAKAALAREGERPRKVEAGAVVSTLGETDHRQLNDFYGLYSAQFRERQQKQLSDELGTIRAVIHQEQQITDGGRVQLRLLEPVLVQGIQIPANTLVYGIGRFGTERVDISLNSLQYEGRIFPIKLTVHDMDGMPGVFVPNVLAAQEGKQVLGQTLGGANYNLSSPSVGNTRAAATLAGISAAQAGLSGARSMLQRNITRQKATLKGNYYVLLN